MGYVRIFSKGTRGRLATSWLPPNSSSEVAFGLLQRDYTPPEGCTTLQRDVRPSRGIERLQGEFEWAIPVEVIDTTKNLQVGIFPTL